jgi:predicted small integral membrane protein
MEQLYVCPNFQFLHNVVLIADTILDSYLKYSHFESNWVNGIPGWGFLWFSSVFLDWFQ